MKLNVRSYPNRKRLVTKLVPAILEMRAPELTSHRRMAPVFLNLRQRKLIHPLSTVSMREPLKNTPLMGAMPLPPSSSS